MNAWIAAAIYAGLWGFGWFYNQFVERLGADAEGLTWLLVVGGVAVTLAGLGALDVLLPGWNAGVLGLTAFVCSGFWMALGDVQRFVRLRRRFMVWVQEQADDAA